MDPRTANMDHYRMQRTATLAQQVLERAKTRKLDWPLPAVYRRTFKKQEGDGEEACLAASFAAVAEHMGCISAECERFYCCAPPFQFKEYEVAHIFRYHSKEASQNLLKAFQDDVEGKSGPIVEEPGYPNTASSALISRKNVSEPEDVCIEVAPGTYTVGVFSHEDTIKQAHLVQIQPGQTVNLSFEL